MSVSCAAPSPPATAPDSSTSSPSHDAATTQKPGHDTNSTNTTSKHDGQPRDPEAKLATSPSSSQEQSSLVFESSFLSQDADAYDEDVTERSMTEDGGRHPKARRKRTTNADKMILEEAYTTNPKPDKQARFDIVQRVSMTEKEVQIWFQNRRQNDRRKARPLEPHEIASLRFPRNMASTSESTASQGIVSVPDTSHPVSDPPTMSHPMLSSSPQPRPVTALQNQSIAARATPLHAHIRSVSDLTATTPHQHQAGHDSRHEEATPPSQESQAGSHTASQSFSGPVGYLANRWNLGSSFSTPSTQGSARDEFARTDLIPPSSCSSQASQAQSESQSQLRLTLSLEGQAQLVSNSSPSSPLSPLDSSQTSPPLAMPRYPNLQRSHSAMPSITLPSFKKLEQSLYSEGTLLSSQPPRLGRGRSKDVLAWESCADADTRDELTALAECESTGSATAAISLLRSSSGSVLQPSGSGKRNAPASKLHRSDSAKRTKLSRASTSTGRLESLVTPSSAQDLSLEKVNPSKVDVSSLLASPTDSDKENWVPVGEGNAPLGRQRRRRPLPSSGGARSPAHKAAILRESGPKQGFLGGRALTAPTKRRGAGGDVSIFEDSENSGLAAPEESLNDVERFMRGEVSPGKKGDLACAAGLLSLAKGAWR